MFPLWEKRDSICHVHFFLYYKHSALIFVNAIITVPGAAHSPFSDSSSTRYHF